MKLQILVNQYNETEHDISPLLNSLSIQQGIDLDTDVSMIICNDGSNEILSDSYLESFPYKIAYIKSEHKGVCATRNILLDVSSADYVMFCDADDMFSSAYGLYTIFSAIQSGFDIFVSSFHEDVYKQGKHAYVPRNNDCYFVHGKVFRRQFLMDNDLRWDESFLYSGDTYFLSLALRTKCKKVYCNNPFYLYKWNDNSICRREKHHFQKSQGIKIAVSRALLKEHLRRGQLENAQYTICDIVYDSYYLLTMAEFDSEETKNEIEKLIKDLYEEYSILFDTTPEVVKNAIIKNQKNSWFISGKYFESVTFSDWFDRILSS